MLESVTIFLASSSFILTVLMFLTSREEPVWGAIFGILAASLWFIGAAAIISVDIPYSHLYENTADNSYLVVSGTSTTTVNAPLRFVFSGLGFMCFAFSIAMILSLVVEAVKKK